MYVGEAHGATQFQMLKRTEFIECSSLHIHTLMKEAAMQHGNQLIRSDTAHSIQTIP